MQYYFHSEQQQKTLAFANQVLKQLNLNLEIHCKPILLAITIASKQLFALWVALAHVIL